MKSFSKALILSVAMLATGFAQAKNKEANEVAVVLNMPEAQYNPAKYFFRDNKKNWDKLVLAHFNGASTDAEKVQILTSLAKIQSAVQARLQVKFDKELNDFLNKIDALIARITSENRFKKAYVALIYNGKVCKLEKREWRKVAAKAILNKWTVKADAAA